MIYLQKIDQDYFKKAYNNFKSLPLFNSKKTIILTTITIALLIFVLTKINFSLFFKALSLISLKYVIIFTGLSLLQTYLYFLRFNFLIGKNKASLFFGFILGFNFSRVIPPRPFGEYLRLLTTEKYYNTNLKESLVAILLDDFFDTFFAILFAVIATFILSKNVFFWKIIVYIILAFAVLYLIDYINENVSFLKKTFGNKVFKKYYGKIKKIFLEYLKSFLSLNKRVLFYSSILSFLLVIISIFRFYLIFLMFGINLPFFIIAAIWAFANIIANASMLPGGLGAFELSIIYLLEDYSVSSNTLSLMIAFIERFFNVWIIVIFGLIYYFYKNPSLHKLQKEFLQNILIELKKGDKITKNVLNSVKKNVRQIPKNVKKTIDFTKKLKVKK